MDRVSAYAADLARGQIPAHPFVLMGQMNKADPTRSPPGTETVWAYTHVPHTPAGDAARRTHRQVDRSRRRRVRRSDGSGHRGTGARVPLADHRAPPLVATRTRSAQRQPRGWRARRRHDGVLTAARVPAGARARSSRDAGARPVPRVGVGTSRRRCPRRVRRERGARRRCSPIVCGVPSAGRDSATDLAQLAELSARRAERGEVEDTTGLDLRQHRPVTCDRVGVCGDERVDTCRRCAVVVALSRARSR